MTVLIYLCMFSAFIWELCCITKPKSISWYKCVIKSKEYNNHSEYDSIRVQVTMLFMLFSNLFYVLGFFILSCKGEWIPLTAIMGLSLIAHFVRPKMIKTQVFLSMCSMSVIMYTVIEVVSKL